MYIYLLSLKHVHIIKCSWIKCIIKMRKKINILKVVAIFLLFQCYNKVHIIKEISCTKIKWWKELEEIINIHIESQWPLRFKHKCIGIITIIKRNKYSLPPSKHHTISPKGFIQQNITTLSIEIFSSQISIKIEKSSYTQSNHYPRPITT